MVEAKVVIGANYGDEGKGQTVDCLCSLARKNSHTVIVVCTNGGPQRGHTVELADGTNHVFHHFGSGTLRNVPTYFSDHFMVNPITFHEEWVELATAGIFPQVYMDPECRITTPYDMLLNQAVEESRGDARHGSCGMGIWETVRRYNAGIGDLHAKEFLQSQSKYKVISGIRDYAGKCIMDRSENLNGRAQEYMRVIDADGLVEHFLTDMEFMAEHITWAKPDILSGYHTVIFENGQGLMLNGDKAENKNYATPSPTGLKIPMEMIVRTGESANIEAYYVSRTYLTKHGAGPLLCECRPEDLGKNIHDETNVYNEHQGELRYAPLVYSDLKKRIQEDLNPYPDVSPAVLFTHCNEVPVHKSAKSLFEGWETHESYSVVSIN